MDQRNIYLLDHNLTAKGVLSNRMPFSLPFFDDLQEKSLDDLTDTLTLTIPADHPTAKDVLTNCFLLYPIKEDDVALYKIMEITEKVTGNIYLKEVYCEISAQDDLLKDVVRPAKFVASTTEKVVDYILGGSGWVSHSVDDFGIIDYAIEDYPTKLEALVEFAKSVGAEIEFKYKTKGADVYSQQVNFVEAVGKETGKLFTHGKDVIGVERITDTTKLVTAMIGVGKAKNDVPMTFAKTNVSVPSGYEKPTGADWVGSESALEKYGDKGEHIYGVYKDDKARSETELFTNTLKALKQYSRPLVTYKVTVAILEKLTGYEHMSVELGDVINVQDETMIPALYVQARIKKVSRSITNPQNDAVELGDYIAVVPKNDSIISQLQAKIRAKEEDWNETTYKVEVFSSNGLIFKNGALSTTLTATVYRGKGEITPLLADGAFSWKKFNKFGVEDTAWSNLHKGVGPTVVITAEDVNQKATFRCDVDVDIIK